MTASADLDYLSIRLPRMKVIKEKEGKKRALPPCPYRVPTEFPVIGGASGNLNSLNAQGRNLVWLSATSGGGEMST